MRTRAIAVPALIALACGSTPDSPRNPALPIPAGTSLHASAPGALPAPAAGRVVIGPTRAASLPVALVEIQGADAVLAVHDEAGADAAFVQRVGADGELGPVVMLPRAHVAAAFALDKDADLTIATTEGEELCITTLAGAERRSRGCQTLRPDLLTRMTGRILALWTEPPGADDDDNTVLTKPVRPPPKKPPANRKRRPKKQPSAVGKLFSSGREQEVMARWILPDGSSPLEPVPTGLRFVEPMVGMGLIGAAARADRVDVVFYEKGKLRGKERRGAFGVAALDEAGTFVEGTRKSFGESKLAAGFLTDHVDPTLLAFGEASILLAHRGARGKCEATVVAPFLMQMIPDDETCAIEPRSFFRQAQALRRGKGKAKGSAAPAASRPAGIERDKLHRVTGQARWDVGRVVLTESQAFALYNDKLVSWKEGEAVRTTARPLVSEQSRIFGGAIALDGTALAHTSAGLVTIDAAGKTTVVPGGEPRLRAGEDRADVAKVERRLAVKIAGTWVQAEGELRRLAPEPAPARRALHPDTTVLTGGAASGLLFELAGPALTVGLVSHDGEVKPATRIASSFAPGFDAVERFVGGALVAGRNRARPEQIEVLAFDAQGNPIGGSTVGKLLEDSGGRLRLHAIVGGGAVLTESAGRGLVWLDPTGKLLASAPWPTETSDAACWDGFPMRTLSFGAEPGKLVANAAAAQRGTCVTAMAFASDGSLRWLGSTAVSIHTRAELGITPPAGAAPGSPPPAETGARGGPAPAARCPGEMVLVGASLCVDRYESTLVDPERGRYTSPDYPPTPAALSGAFGDFLTRREQVGDVFARALPLPRFPSWQAEAASAFAALSREAVRPSGYVSGAMARLACERAGKRLCKLEEWRTACRGEQNQLFPYGATYTHGACNVNGPVHPAATLRDNASIGHLDPRLNRVEASGETVLRVTGATKRCASRWGDDAIFDMVGNVDEWVDEEGGAFAGGFYARGTTNGCEALVSNHPEGYFDYSTGVRCCADAR